MKYYISLYSKHTGDRIVLGCKYNTREDAIEYADNNVCTKCNSYEISYTQDHYVWMDKHHGFVDPTSVRSIRDTIKDVELETELMLRSRREVV